MDNLKRCMQMLTLAAGVSLSGCVSTLPSESNVRDPEVYEQKNLDIAIGFLEKGYPERAIARLNEVLKENKGSFRAYGILGVAYREQGEYPLAEDSFKRSLDLNPAASDVRNNYGGLLFLTGKYKEAQKQFERVTEDIYYVNRSRAFENLGFVALKMNNRDEARTQFERALRLDQNIPAASLELAEILLEDGNYVESERYFGHYENLTRRVRPSSRALWLGIQLARIFDQRDKFEQYAELLARYYPGSKEYREYKASLRYRRRPGIRG